MTSDPEDIIDEILAAAIPGPRTVEIDGVDVRITPVNELGPFRSMSASIALSRITAAAEEEDHTAANRELLSLLELCLEDGITAKTLATLTPRELRTLLKTALGDALNEANDS